MARRHYQVGRDVASETESDGVGQRNLEEVDETGIGHLRALSPWLLMMMMTQKPSAPGLQLVLGQNGSGQNGTDKMGWTKWYTDKMVLDKMVWTKWYGQNGTDKTLTIKSSSNTLIPLPLTKKYDFVRQSCFHFKPFR